MKIYQNTQGYLYGIFYTWRWSVCYIISKNYALQRCIYELMILFRFQFFDHGKNKYLYAPVTGANTQILLACGR